MNTFGLFANIDEIRSVVERFESFEFKPGEFKHHHHLTVALWYLDSLSSKTAAIDRMRTQLKAFTAHLQVKAYHETITIFWMELANSFREQHSRDSTVQEIVNQLIVTYPSSKEILNFYSQGLLDSEAAKNRFIAPDLKPLPEGESLPQAASSQINISS